MGRAVAQLVRAEIIPVTCAVGILKRFLKSGPGDLGIQGTPSGRRRARPARLNTRVVTAQSARLTR